MEKYSKRRRVFRVTLDVPEHCSEDQIVAWIKHTVETGPWTGDPHFPPKRDNIRVQRRAKKYG